MNTRNPNSRNQYEREKDFLNFPSSENRNPDTQEMQSNRNNNEGNNDRNLIYVIPPLLREDVFQQSVQRGEYLLVYLVNSGYIEDIINWHKENSTVEVHCFIDRKSSHDVEQFHDRLFFHRINDSKFFMFW